MPPIFRAVSIVVISKVIKSIVMVSLIAKTVGCLGVMPIIVVWQYRDCVYTHRENK
jgi:hypothetical protein